MINSVGEISRPDLAEGLFQRRLNMTSDDLDKGNQELLEGLQQLDEAMGGEEFTEEELAIIEGMKELTHGLINISNRFIKIGRKLEGQPPTEPYILELMAEYEALDPNDKRAKDLWQ